MFSWEICEICKNTFFTEHLQWLLLNKIVLSGNIQDYFGTFELSTERTHNYTRFNEPEKNIHKENSKDIPPKIIWKIVVWRIKNICNEV